MSDNQLSQWADLIRSGGAKTFFDTFTEDAELATKVNGLFQISVSEDQIRRDRKRFYLRPRLGEKREEKEASPTKSVIRNKALQLDVQQALAEVLDNIFDNRDRNKPDKLRVEIVVFPKTEVAPGEIVITENSGGIERERVVPLIQLGLSDKSAGGIGAWGEGFKMASFALGEEIEVFSHHLKEQQAIGIHFPKGWLDAENSLWREWKVNTYSVENPPPIGTTVVRINYLHTKVLQLLGLEANATGKTPESACKELADYFSEVYAEKYRTLVAQGYDVNINITIGDVMRSVQFMKPVKTRLQENLAFIPWLRPIHWTAAWQIELEEGDKKRIAKLNVEIYAGLAATFNYSPSYPPQDPGVEMWGNGRLFSLQGRITDESVGWGYTFGGSGGTNPTSNASSRRVTIVVLFTADDSRDIPWAAPVKNDYNRRSEFYAEIQEIFARVIRLFKDAQQLLASRLLPFSYHWTTLSDEEKLDTLFEDSDATPKSKKKFASSRFGKKLLQYGAPRTFHEIVGKDANRTVHSLYGIESVKIRETVKAAAETKQSAEQVVEFLQAIFPNLYKQAKLEERMELQADEELVL